MSRDLPVIIELELQNLNISLRFCAFARAIVCGLVPACVMSVLWVGKGILLRQTAL